MDWSRANFSSASCLCQRTQGTSRAKKRFCSASRLSASLKEAQLSLRRHIAYLKGDSGHVLPLAEHKAVTGRLGQVLRQGAGRNILADSFLISSIRGLILSSNRSIRPVTLTGCPRTSPASQRPFRLAAALPLTRQVAGAAHFHQPA